MNARLRNLFRAYIDAVVPLTEWPEPVDVDGLLDDIDAHISSIPTTLRLPLEAGLIVLEVAPLATGQGLARLSRIDCASRLRVIQAIEGRPGLVFSAMLEALQTFVFMNLGARPEIHRCVGTDRTAFIAELCKARDDELRETGEAR